MAAMTDDSDEDDEAQEAEVEVSESGADPGHGSGCEEELVEQVVDGQGDEDYEDHCDTQAEGRLDILRYSQE